MKNHALIIVFFMALLMPNCLIAQKESESDLVKNLLYFDSSSSMKGYLNATADDRFISSLAGFIYNPGMEIHLFGIDEGNTVSVSTFENQLNTRSIKWNPESDLTQMINSMVKRISNENIKYGILITDGIMSGSNRDIRTNPSYNITRRGVLTQKIQNVFNSYKAQNRDSLCAVILRYESEFTGTYYDYRNTKINLINAERPYYAIILVRINDLASCLDEVEHNESLSKFSNTYVIGDRMPQLSITPYKKTGVLIKDKETEKVKMQLNSSEIQKNDKKVLLTVNISKLPVYMKDSSYIHTNFDLWKEGKGQEMNRIPREKYWVDVTSKRIIISIDPSHIKGSTIKVSLLAELPNWIEESTSQDDSNINSDNKLELSKTFNFKYLIDGFSPLILGREISSKELTICK